MNTYIITALVIWWLNRKQTAPAKILDSSGGDGSTGNAFAGGGYGANVGPGALGIGGTRSVIPTGQVASSTNGALVQGSPTAVNVGPPSSQLPAPSTPVIRGTPVPIAPGQSFGPMYPAPTMPVVVPAPVMGVVAPPVAPVIRGTPVPIAPGQSFGPMYPAPVAPPPAVQSLCASGVVPPEGSEIVVPDGTPGARVLVIDRKYLSSPYATFVGPFLVLGLVANTGADPTRISTLLYPSAEWDDFCASRWGGQPPAGRGGV